MASILDKYGIKEVADLTFYHIGNNGQPDYPVLYIDTAKTTTTETTAETTYAQGGKGNARLIAWDFGKAITMNIEDALFSPKSLAIMYGGNIVTGTAALSSLIKTIEFQCSNSGSGISTWTDEQGNVHSIAGTVEYFEANGTASISASELTTGNMYYAKFNVAVKDVTEIQISPNQFPETYYITADTYARAEVNGVDENFQIIIPKGKVTSDTTLTLEAEGDPSVFNMSIEVLRPGRGQKGEMMKLVKYALDEQGNA